MAATVLQLSDTHLVREPGGLVMRQDPDDRLARVLAAWSDSGHAADLVVLTGDNADDGSPQAYAKLHAVVSALGAPLLALAGNHDDPAAMSAVFGADRTAEVDGWRVVAANSAVADQVHGTVDAQAVADTLDRLDERPTVVGIHHPPRSRITHPYFRLEAGDELLEVLGARPHVRALISGHLHDAFEFPGPGHLQLLGAPSTLAAMAHDGDRYTTGADAPTGARVLTLGEDGSLTSSLVVA